MILRAAFLLLFGCCALPSFGQITVAGFDTYVLQGFQVLVSEQMQADHPGLSQEGIRYLDTLLGKVVYLGLADDIMDSLRKVPIFMEWAVAGTGAWYHPDVNWLIQNGYNPAKAKSVEIANLTYFLNWSRQNQPWIIMHELGHAYHDQVLGYNEPAIIAAYDSAMIEGLYNSVLYNPGFGNPPFAQAAYAKTNYIEYFAEITEAYLGENDYFPFDSTDLRTHDPRGYRVVSQVWRLGGTTSVERGRFLPMELELAPNPGTDLVKVTIPQTMVPCTLRLMNVHGQVIQEVEVNETYHILKLDNLSSGVYLLQATDLQSSTQAARLIKQ